MPDPELYILVNGHPTKNKVVWQTLVDVNGIKKAADKLKEINIFYKNVTNDVIDSSTKKAIEAVSNTSSTMLEKCSKVDVDSFQAYTIRRMDEKLPVGLDCDHYKTMTVQEPSLDSRQALLDVMCFPTLFPTGQYGQYHPRDVKLNFSEYAKSRLLNKDSCFRKSPEFIFYNLWLKELRELSCGIYNTLKNNRPESTCISVNDFVRAINNSDQKLETNLNTMFQSIRGSKQFWFLRRSEVLCMLREWGPPALFLNDNISDNYPIGKLCTEDPISVTHKFDQKFHNFFSTLKGKVLGKVTHHFVKKEYQARGAPHYHVLLWIENAPVIGINSDDEVLQWIQERITCRIPDQASNPELHWLVTKYQTHRCSNYCKRRKKVNNTFITKCKFGFPRVETEQGVINSVDECLKTRSKIYSLPRSSMETKINDYSPILLLIWKANLDIQYVSDSSLAIAHYVTGYVTKAETSRMQEEFEEISDNQTLYSKLWSFGVRSLQHTECGLYEAADLLLGNHLCSKI